MPPLRVTRWRKGAIATVTLTLKDYGLPIPDLTKGGKPNKTLDWALGPIGVNGWGYSERPDRGASKHARQFLAEPYGNVLIAEFVIQINALVFSIYNPQGTPGKKQDKHQYQRSISHGQI